MVWRLGSYSQNKGQNKEAHIRIFMMLSFGSELEILELDLSNLNPKSIT